MECYGTEDKLTECAMKSYSLKDGNNLQDKVDVAGVSCILSSSNNFTSISKMSIVSSPSVTRSSPSDQPHQSSLSKMSIVSSPSVTRSSPSDQPHHSSLSQTSILSVVSIILVCLLFIVILFLW